MITSRPIIFTGDIPGWRRLLDVLGGRPLVEAPGWVVYAMPSGRVALHDAEHSPYRPGHVQLGFETADLTAWSQTTAAEHVVEETDHGTAATVRATDGQWFWVDTGTRGTADSGAAASPQQGAVAALPIWMTPETEPAVELLRQVGASDRIRREDGGWVDLTCPEGGLVAAHEDESVSAVMAFEHAGDIEQLRARVTDAGLDALLIDESYSRTLQLPDPDGGPRIWVNEQQTDLYGFRRAGE